MNLIDLLDFDERKFVKVVHYKKGTNVFFEDEKCESLGFVNLGKLEISSILKDGRKVIYNTLRMDDIFGGNLIFSSDPTYKGDVIALTDCVILFIAKNDLEKILQNNTKFLEGFLKHQSDFAKALNFKIKLLSIESAKERILYYLQYCGGRKRIESVTRLSEEISLSREATSRTLSKLIDDNKIEKKGKYLFIR